MNVLFLSMTFPDCISPERGTYNLELCAALARRHRVAVIAPRSWRECLEVRRAGNRYEASAEARRHGLEVAYPVYWYLPKLQTQAMGAALWHSVRGAVLRMAKEARPDFVVSYWAFPDGDAGLRIARHFDIPSVVIVGGSDVLLLPDEPGRGAAVRRVLAQSSMVATVSDGLRQASIELGVPPTRIRTVRQGINPDVFAPGDKADARRTLGLDQDSEVLLWVGRMVEVKNLDLLVTVMKRLAQDRPKLRLHLIGDGRTRKSIAARVTEEGLSAAIRFEGPVAHDRLPMWFRAADATVLSSHSEGLPNVLRESLACGVPFVATDVGDIREIAEPGLSRLVPPGDADAFVSEIAAVLEQSGGAPAVRYLARTWNDCAVEFSAMLQDVVGADALAACTKVKEAR